MKKNQTENEQLAADAVKELEESPNNVVHLRRIKPNRKGGKYLAGGARAANRGEITRTCHTIAAIYNFYGLEVPTN